MSKLKIVKDLAQILHPCGFESELPIALPQTITPYFKLGLTLVGRDKFKNVGDVLLKFY